MSKQNKRSIGENVKSEPQASQPRFLSQSSPSSSRRPSDRIAPPPLVPSSSSSSSTLSKQKPPETGESLPFANRSSILNHTHATNRSIKLSQLEGGQGKESNEQSAKMPALVAQQLSDGPGLSRSGQLDDLVSNEAKARLSVRRASGQRAESESVALGRRGSKMAGRQPLYSHFETDADDASPRRTSLHEKRQEQQGQKAPFASTVRRIFRSRSKSQSAPSKNNGKSVSESVAPDANGKTETNEEKNMREFGGIPAVPPTSMSTASSILSNGPIPASLSSSSSTRRQSRDSGSKAGSFFLGLGRARTPPRTKSDWEGVEGGARSRSSSTASKNANAQWKRLSGTSEKGNRGASGASGKQRERRISGLPPSSSEGPQSMLKTGSQEQQDRTLTIQSLSTRGTPGSPYAARRSSLLNSPSSTSKRLPGDSSSSQGHTARAEETPTPTNIAMNGIAEKPEPQATGKDSVASVPRIWQMSRNSRASMSDESGMPDSQYAKQRFGSSTTSGSALSFRTAPSFRDEATPDIPLSVQTSNLTGNGTFHALPTLSRSATSPLTDLIENLENRLSSSGSSTPIGGRAAALYQANNSASGSKAGSTLRFPTSSSLNETNEEQSRDYGDIDDDDESNFSQVSRVSQLNGSNSPMVLKRNTFGGDGSSTNANRTSTNSFSHGSYWERDGQSGRNVSVQEIESSLAAVEAALKDHRKEGSLDPNSLLQHISPRTPQGNRSTASLSMMNGGSVLDDSVTDLAGDEDERRARVTIPPEQQFAIADAVRQVRRAISSQNLPQIPNEEDSDVSRSPAVEHPRGPESEVLMAQMPSHGISATPWSATPYLQPKTASAAVSEHTSAIAQESTPLRAARIRQESMQDVEQAYARMVDLVSSAAGIDLTPSPMPVARFFPRRSTQSQPSQPVTLDQSTKAALNQVDLPESPSHRHHRHDYIRERTQSAAPTPASLSMQGWTSVAPPSVPALPPIAASSSRSARQQLLRESDALARHMAPLPDLSEETGEHGSSSTGLRGRTSNVSLSSRGSRRAASESPQRLYRHGTQDASLISTSGGRGQEDITFKMVTDQPIGHMAPSSLSGSGGGASGTSPSITVKTQGTPHASEYRDIPAGKRASGVESQLSQQRQRNDMQHALDWQTQSRFSSPSSAQVVTSQQSKRLSGTSNDSGNVSRPLASSSIGMNETQRRIRASNRLSGSIDARHSPDQQASVFESTTGSAMAYGDSVTGSYRRSGSIRDWGRMEDVPSNGPGTHTGSARSHFMRPSDGSDPSDMARMALLNSRIASPSTSSVVAMQRRHALERDSLLDMLDRTRTEAMEMRSRNERLQSDLHLEVTRVLELERDVERRREREEQLAERVRALEEDLKTEQADRVRIGELLERVQRAVDEAANGRGGSREMMLGDDDEVEMQHSSLADETMEIVHMPSSSERGMPRSSSSSHAPFDGLDIPRREVSSPTSSSVSIRQEDLLPVKRRVFDAIRSDDEDLVQQPSVLQSLRKEVSNSSADDEALLDEHSIGHGTMDDRSPSLDSHASVLGLDVQGQEMGWSLDEEALPEDVDARLPSVENAMPSTPPLRFSTARSQASRLNESSEEGNMPADEHLSSFDDSPRLKRSPPRPKRSIMRSPGSASRLPVLSKQATGMSTSTSGASTVIGGSSTLQQKRIPSLRNLPPRDMRDTSLEATPSLSPRSARQVSQSSRTTGGDTSYTAQTVSPVGSFIPTFPTMSSGVRRAGAGSGSMRMTSHGSNQSSIGGGGDGSVGLGDTSLRSPPTSPSRSRLLNNGTSSKAAPVKEARSTSAAMRSAGGYYDTRRPPGYDPVDVSVLSVLSAEDSL